MVTLLLGEVFSIFFTSTDVYINILTKCQMKERYRMVIRVMGKDGAWCNCDECGKLFHVQRWALSPCNQFCSQYCNIVWHGRQYHWNNATMIRKMKVFMKLTGWDYDLTKPGRNR